MSDHPATLAQLTIFFGGEVSVFDEIPPEKAQAIMLIAAATAAGAGATYTAAPVAKYPVMATVNTSQVVASPVLKRSLSLQSSSVVVAQAQVAGSPNSSLCSLQADLPIARRHSLQLFLEKRRDSHFSCSSPSSSFHSLVMPRSTSPSSGEDEKVG